MKLNLKIQSISDIITNSSTEVFIVYDVNNKDSIKNLVNAILSIDGHYTFDDLFQIEMIVTDTVISDLWDEYFEELSKQFKSEEEFDDYLQNTSVKEQTEWELKWRKIRDWDCYYSFYSGYSVHLQEGVTNTDKLQRAIDAIRSIDSIFEMDYSCE